MTSVLRLDVDSLKQRHHRYDTLVTYLQLESCLVTMDMSRWVMVVDVG